MFSIRILETMTLETAQDHVRLPADSEHLGNLQVTTDLLRLPENTISLVFSLLAGVAELADALDLGSCARKGVGVRLPPSAI